MNYYNTGFNQLNEILNYGLKKHELTIVYGIGTSYQTSLGLTLLINSAVFNFDGEKHKELYIIREKLDEGDDLINTAIIDFVATILNLPEPAIKLLSLGEFINPYLPSIGEKMMDLNSFFHMINFNNIEKGKTKRKNVLDYILESISDLAKEKVNDEKIFFVEIYNPSESFKRSLSKLANENNVTIIMIDRVSSETFSLKDSEQQYEEILVSINKETASTGLTRFWLDVETINGNVLLPLGANGHIRSIS